MNFQTWLSTLSKERTFSHPVVCLTSSSYPLLFCTQLITHIQKNLDQTITRLSVSDYELSEIKPQLEMSFLGQKSVYWLHSFDELSSKKKDEWFSYLETYRGPHGILFFSQIVPRSSASSWGVLQIPEHADKSLSITILEWHNNNARYGLDFIEKLYQFEDRFPIDTAALLVRYALLNGANQQQFFTELLHKIVEPNSSLFSLSQALFGKSKQQFFRQWSQVMDYYAPQFWISFWSEQLWRAHAYARLSQNGEYAEAKKIGYRLPFSYLNRDWRRYTGDELQRAHNFLYTVDFNLKNGGSSFALDLFIFKFLSGSFA